MNDMKDHRNNEQVRSAGVIVLVGKDFALKRLERDFKLRVGRAHLSFDYMLGARSLRTGKLRNKRSKDRESKYLHAIRS